MLSFTLFAICVFLLSYYKKRELIYLKKYIPLLRIVAKAYNYACIIGFINENDISKFLICPLLCAAMRILETEHRPSLKVGIFDLWWPPYSSIQKIERSYRFIRKKARVSSFPSYSPELNLSKQVWNNANTHVVVRKDVIDPDQFKTSVLGRLRKLQKLPRITC